MKNNILFTLKGLDLSPSVFWQYCRVGKYRIEETEKHVFHIVL